MSEYLKVSPNENCRLCVQYNCINTELIDAELPDNPVNNISGRVRYDKNYLMHLHTLPIKLCPTKNMIDDERMKVGKGLLWKLVEAKTIEKAIGVMDKAMVGETHFMLVTDKKSSPEK